MQHQKTYHQEILTINDREIVIEGPVSSDTLKTYSFDDGLDAFRRPKDQFEAILEIADLDEGRIIVARDGDHIIGYVTYHYPDELERWSDGNLPYLIELGAVEIALGYRSGGIGSKLIQLTMEDSFVEHYIIITTEYYWHWDLKNNSLSVYEYKDIMIKLMASAGFEVFQTNDPEITAHPANTLMARIGKNIEREQMMEFDKIRFKDRFFF